MKKLVFAILAVCLAVGIPLMVMDKLSGEIGVFNIPAGYSRIEINLEEAAGNNETVLSLFLKEPEFIDLVMQSDSESQKVVKVKSDQRFNGRNADTLTFDVGKITGNSWTGSNFLASPGNLTISVTCQKAKGKLVIGYRERKVSASEFERMTKIDGGELDNAPEGYRKVYGSDLAGLNCKDKTVYTLTLDKPQNIGLCVYTNSKQGNVSVDFVGKNSNYTGLVYSNYNAICDQLVQTLDAGAYEVRLTSENADGQVIVFIKD